jgi:hypothetical protein
MITIMNPARHMDRTYRSSPQFGGRDFTVHHDTKIVIERDGRQLGYLRAWCRSCNSLESIGADAIPQFDRSPYAEGVSGTDK